MQNIKIVFESEMWEAYDENSTLPMHSETNYENIELWAKANGLNIVKVDSSQLD